MVENILQRQQFLPEEMDAEIGLASQLPSFK
jgi:hypothetical protein